MISLLSILTLDGIAAMSSAQDIVTLASRVSASDAGGWALDAQFMDTVGSPYLLAHGETCISDSFALDGAWEMSYRPNAWEAEECPKFDGARVEKAVPGFWEDMIPAFRAAGINDEFKINPAYARQKLPIYGRAKDTTLPSISGCFLYRRSLALEKTPQGAAFLAFDCVRNKVRVWVNGRFAAAREGFSTPFELAVPDGFLRRGDNEIVLSVSNDPCTGYNGQPVSGMTTRGPHVSTGGIEGRCELRFAQNGLPNAQRRDRSRRCIF